MLYIFLKDMLTRQSYTNCEEMQTKLDIFYAKGRITIEQYDELSGMVVHTCAQ